ncbi:MAG TPA: hypothetical protein VEK85_11810 [Gemmatimonadales bacterium]|nr:hypothetical protein [Gemmatimonadales bacterium]
MNARTPVAIVLAVALTACHGGRPDLDTRTFELKYLREHEASALISPYVYADRPEGKGVFSVAGTMITVRETRDNLDKIARVLAEYDRPRPTVRLTFRLIEADGTPTVDPAIADIEAVLRKLFRFRGYRLAAEGVVSGVEGSQVSQMLSGPAGRYDLGAEIDRLSGKGDSATVQLGVRLNLYPGAFMTRLGVPLGKTAVLGNLSGDRGKTTLILTVRPEVISASP